MSRIHSKLASIFTPVLALVFLLMLSVGQASSFAKEQLVVYTYDSFASGPAQELKEGFEALNPDVEVVFFAPGSSGETVARLIAELETGGSPADVLIGIADTQLPRALERNVFERLDLSLIPNLDTVPESLRFDDTGHVVPFDTGYVTIIYDRDAMDEADLPQSLEDLTHERFRNKLIAIDPRTSSVGHAFLMWTIAEYGDPGYLEYWRRLEPNLLTITGGWSAAYNHYSSGEAPMMISYSTDTAYGVMYADSEQSQVLTPQGQAYTQIEAAGIVRGTDQYELAHRFLDYALSVDAQQTIPTTNWMFPVNANTPLPEAWEKHAVIPENPVRLDAELIEANEATWLREWARLIVR